MILCNYFPFHFPRINENGHQLEQIQGDGSTLLSPTISYPMLEVTINKILEQNKLEVLVHKAMLAIFFQQS